MEELAVMKISLHLLDEFISRLECATSFFSTTISFYFIPLNRLVESRECHREQWWRSLN